MRAPTPGVETPDQELARLRSENKALRAEQTKLGSERHNPRSAAKYFAEETNWRAASSSSPTTDTPSMVSWLCAVIEIARSSFYAWLTAADMRAGRQAADAEFFKVDEALEVRIRVVDTADSTYGAPRITAELNDGAADAEWVNHKWVARVMGGAGIAGFRRRRRVKTTVPDPGDQKVPDLLGRDFTASAPNTKYVGDITYLPLATGGNLYLATVIDCHSRRVAGRVIAEHMSTELVEDALKSADSLRRSGRLDSSCRSRK